MTARSPSLPAGPYTADQIAEGEPYEADSPRKAIPIGQEFSIHSG